MPQVVDSDGFDYSELSLVFLGGSTMGKNLSVSFTGLRFENPFLLASAPPTESENNIMRAFDAGWGGVVTKTIGLHPVVDVAGPKTTFLSATPDSPTLSIKKRPGTVLLLVELGAHLR